jgi:hypothetical protein
MTLAEDLATYLPRLGRSHPLDRYTRAAQFVPDTDEAIVLEAMRHAHFSLWHVERRHETAGLILRDVLRGDATRHRLGTGSSPSAREARSYQIQPRRRSGHLTEVTATSAIAKRDRKPAVPRSNCSPRFNMDAATRHWLSSIIGSAPIDKAPTRREHSGEAMLGPLGSIPG